MSGNGTVIPTFSKGNVLPDVKTLSTGGNTYNYASNQVGGQQQRKKSHCRTGKKRAVRKSRTRPSRRCRKTRHNRKK